MNPRVAVVGATGAVGRMMVKILGERNFPLSELKLFASERSEGEKIYFNAGYRQVKKFTVEVLSESSFKNSDIALFSAGSSVSKEIAPLAISSGCYVVDNSSAWRMNPGVPLIVPEVNSQDIDEYWKNGKMGLIANPNCSTIQMVVALSPIQNAVGIKRIVVSTYQSVSGTGQKGISELGKQIKAYENGYLLQRMQGKVYPYPIFSNCIPHIDDFTESGDTKEELKMINETRKILGIPRMPVSATCVRVPVFYGHAESINFQTQKSIRTDELRELLSNSPGVEIIDNPKNAEYPTQLAAVDKDKVFVGRIRKDRSAKNSFNMWVVADNLRKGAATNAVQIAELLLEKYL
ncbi:MAG: aspartate-semialdehyde dehydrogenase [Candidatus Spechtbacterales bacterium]